VTRYGQLMSLRGTVRPQETHCRTRRSTLPHPTCGAVGVVWTHGVGMPHRLGEACAALSLTMRVSARLTVEISFCSRTIRAGSGNCAVVRVPTVRTVVPLTGRCWSALLSPGVIRLQWDEGARVTIDGHPSIAEW